MIDFRDATYLVIVVSRRPKKQLDTDFPPVGNVLLSTGLAKKGSTRGGPTAFSGKDGFLHSMKLPRESRGS